MNDSVARVSLTRRHLLVSVVALMAVAGLGVGLISGGPGPGTGVGPVTPPGTGDASTADATLSVTVGDPPTVRNDDGRVGTVAGTLTGSLAVDGTPDRVDLVVRSRLPSGSWAVVDRAEWRVGDGDLAVGALVGGPNTTYLNASQSAGFDVGTPGTFADRHGAVSVTATVYADGERVSSVTAGDDYTLAVEHLADRTVTLSDDVPTARPTTSAPTDGERGGGGAAGPADDGVGSSRPARLTSALLDVSNAMPGDAAQRSHRVENPTDGAATLRVSVGPVSDDENGWIEPERAVDSTPRTGELSAALEVRLFVERDDGRRQYVAGNDRRFVALADAAGATTSLGLGAGEAAALVVQWRLDGAVGNEVQSDRSTVSVHLSLSGA